MKAIVTVIIGNYDTLKPAPKFEGWETILITDNKYSDSLGWEVLQVQSNDPQKDSRYYKWMLHEVIPEYDLYCYIDGSMELHKEPPNETVFFRHPKRRRVFDEGEMIIKLNKDSRQNVNATLDYFRSEKFKDKNGLFQNGFFVRENNPRMNKLCEVVCEIVCEYSHRDQLALPFALFKTGIELNSVNGRYCREWVKITQHGAKKIQSVNVHHITPGRSDLNFGKSINDIVRNLPDNDWICLRDIDTLPAYHEKFFEQCEAIAEKAEFDLIGCMTNRLGLVYQLHNGKISDDFNMVNHRKIGKQRFEKYGSDVSETSEYIAGLFMLFPKSVWSKIGGFPEGGVRIRGSFIDWHFSKAVRDAGLRTGIAKGIYLIHLYRPDAKNPRRATGHLG